MICFARLNEIRGPYYSVEAQQIFMLGVQRLNKLRDTAPAPMRSQYPLGACPLIPGKVELTKLLQLVGNSPVQAADKVAKAEAEHVDMEKCKGIVGNATLPIEVCLMLLMREYERFEAKTRAKLIEIYSKTSKGDSVSGLSVSEFHAVVQVCM
jgi:hypothetical protein